MAFIHSPRIVTDGLVMCLDAANARSYVSGSTIWRDLIQTNVTASLINGPSFDGRNAGSIVFDGTNDYGSVQSVSGVTDFTLTDPYTVDFWVYVNNTQNDTVGDNSIIEKWNQNSTGGYPYVFRFIRATDGLTTIVSNGVGGSTNATITIIRDTWVHICGVFNQPANSLILYGNGGQLRASATYVGLTSGTISNTDPISLMSRQTIRRATGNLANLKIYNRALSASEVLQNYNALRSRFGV